MMAHKKPSPVKNLYVRWQAPPLRPVYRQTLDSIDSEIVMSLHTAEMTTILTEGAMHRVSFEHHNNGLLLFSPNRCERLLK